MKTFIKPAAYKNINSSQIKLINNKLINNKLINNEPFYQYYYNKLWTIVSLKFLW